MIIGDMLCDMAHKSKLFEPSELSTHAKIRYILNSEGPRQRQMRMGETGVSDEIIKTLEQRRSNRLKKNEPTQKREKPRPKALPLENSLPRELFVQRRTKRFGE